MPYKSEKLQLKPEQDRRRKLTESQKLSIQDWYATGQYSMNALAKRFGVSKTTVLRLVNPESAAKAQAYRKENWSRFQQSREKKNASARNTRRYKQELYERGELAEKKEE